MISIPAGLRRAGLRLRSSPHTTPMDQLTMELQMSDSVTANKSIAAEDHDAPCEKAYKVWIEIEEYDEGTACGSNWGPGSATKIYVQKRMGFFPDTAGNPFKFVILKQGDRNFADPCTGAIQAEYFEGVSTIGGFPAFTFQGGPVVPLGRTFIDVGSSNNEVCMRIKAIPHVVCKLPHVVRNPPHVVRKLPSAVSNVPRPLCTGCKWVGEASFRRGEAFPGRG